MQKNDNLLLFHCGTMDKSLIRYQNMANIQLCRLYRQKLLVGFSKVDSKFQLNFKERPTDSHCFIVARFPVIHF
jgi:hypothetical protein